MVSIQSHEKRNWNSGILSYCSCHACCRAVPSCIEHPQVEKTVSVSTVARTVTAAEAGNLELAGHTCTPQPPGLPDILIMHRADSWKNLPTTGRFCGPGSHSPLPSAPVLSWTSALSPASPHTAAGACGGTHFPSEHSRGASATRPLCHRGRKPHEHKAGLRAAPSNFLSSSHAISQYSWNT